MAEYYLIHSGILGMKWGQRRFQYKDGSLTPAGKIRYGVGNGRKSRAERKIEKKKDAQRSAALEKARKAKAEKKKHQEEKDRILREGSASDLLKIKGELTNKELSDAYQRLNNVSLISALAAKETPKGKSAVEKILSIMDTTAAFTTKAYTIYDNTSKFGAKFKALLDEDEKQRKKEKDQAIEKIIRSGNPALISKNVKKMSNAQLQEAVKRLNSEKAIDDILKKYRESNKQ